VNPAKIPGDVVLNGGKLQSTTRKTSVIDSRLLLANPM
jgi:hypothetical protein